MTPELRNHLFTHSQWPVLDSNDEKIRFLALALVGEAGEMAEYAYASLDDGKHRELAKEVADVGNYLWMVADKFGVELRYGFAIIPAWAIREDDQRRWLMFEIVRETGKFANLVKKDWRGDDGTAERRLKIVSHLDRAARLLWTMAEMLGFDLHAEMLAKMIEVEQRPAWKEAHAS